MSDDRKILVCKMLSRYEKSGACGPNEAELARQLAAELHDEVLGETEHDVHRAAGVEHCVDSPCKICGKVRV